MQNEWEHSVGLITGSESLALYHLRLVVVCCRRHPRYVRLSKQAAEGTLLGYIYRPTFR